MLASREAQLLAGYGDNVRDRFRDWTEETETYLLEVIFGDRPGRKANAIRRVLLFLSHIFAGIVKLRRMLYDARVFRDATLGVQVIAVGNLTVGGTGKTPVVEKFARALQDAGRRVAILSRGYRSKPKPLWERMVDRLLLRRDTTPPRIVSDGRALLLDSETASWDSAGTSQASGASEGDFPDQGGSIHPGELSTNQRPA